MACPRSAPHGTLYRVTSRTGGSAGIGGHMPPAGGAALLGNQLQAARFKIDYAIRLCVSIRNQS